MPGRRTKLRILLSVVALAQILTMPSAGAQTADKAAILNFNETTQEQVSSRHIPRESHRTQRIKRASAERRAAVELSKLAHACTIAGHRS